MKAREILAEQARKRGFSEENIKFAERIVESTNPGYLDREISEKELPGFLAQSNVIQSMPTEMLQRCADKYTRRN